jgi:hypothetical protein
LQADSVDNDCFRISNFLRRYIVTALPDLRYFAI